MSLTLYTLQEILAPNGVLGDNTTGDISAQDMRDVVWSLYNIGGTSSGGTSSGTASLSEVLSYGNRSGANDIILDSGQKLILGLNNELNYNIDLANSLMLSSDFRSGLIVASSSVSVDGKDVSMFTPSNGALLLPISLDPDNDVSNPLNGMIKSSSTDIRAYVNNQWVSLITPTASVIPNLNQVLNTGSTASILSDVIINGDSSNFILDGMDNIFLSSETYQVQTGTVSIYMDNITALTAQYNSNLSYSDLINSNPNDDVFVTRDWVTNVGYLTQSTPSDLQEVLDNGSSADTLNTLSIKSSNDALFTSSNLFTNREVSNRRVNLFGNLDDSSVTYFDRNKFGGFVTYNDITNPSNYYTAIESIADNSTLPVYGIVSVESDISSSEIIINGRVTGTFSDNSIKIETGVGTSDSILIKRDNGTNDNSISLSDIITIKDSINDKGMVYDSDYYVNGSLDDRWIPDWGAVKSYFVNSSSDYFGGTGINLDGFTFSTDASIIPITATVGILPPGTSVQLVLEGLITMAEETQNLQEVLDYGSTASISTDFYVSSTTASVSSSLLIGSGEVLITKDDSFINIEEDRFRLFYNSGTSSSGIYIDDNDMIIIDSIGNKGLRYSSFDYVNQGILDPLWLPNWGSVESYVDDNQLIPGDGLTQSGLTFSVLINPNSSSIAQVTSEGLEFNSFTTQNLYVDDTPISGSSSQIEIDINERLDIWATASPTVNVGDIIIFTDVNELFGTFSSSTYSISYIRAATASNDNTDFLRIDTPDLNVGYIRSLFSGGDGIDYDQFNGIISIDSSIAGDGLSYNNGVISFTKAITLEEVINNNGSANPNSDVSISYSDINSNYNNYKLGSSDNLLESGNSALGSMVSIDLGTSANDGILLLKSVKNNANSLDVGFLDINGNNITNTFGVSSDLTDYNDNIIDSSYVTKLWVEDNFMSIGITMSNYYVENGLSVNGSTFSFGGDLIKDTVIDGGSTHSMSFISSTFSTISDLNLSDVILYNTDLILGNSNLETVNILSGGNFINLISSTNSNSGLDINNDSISIKIDNVDKLKLNKDNNSYSTSVYHNSLDYDGSTFNVSNSDAPFSNTGYRVSNFITQVLTTDSNNTDVDINSNGDKLVIGVDEFWGFEISVVANDSNNKCRFWKISGLVNGTNGSLVSKVIEDIGKDGGDDWLCDVSVVGTPPSTLNVVVNGNSDLVKWNVNGKVTINGGETI